MSRTRPVLTPLLLAASSLLLVAGCAAGNNAQTLKSYAPADGVVANSGDIRLLNTLVVSDASGSTGVLSVTIVNRGDREDTLTGITSKDGTVDLTGSGALPAGKAVRFGATTEPSATISPLTSTAGETISLTFTFAKTEPITVETLVLPARGAYSEITPGPETPVDPATPTDEPTASPSTSPSA